MKESLLCCSVCGQPLTFDEKNARCPKEHCFDRAARGGYVHLLRQHRRGSSDPGDSAAMCQARTRFLEGNWYGPLRDTVAKLAADCAPKDILDAGCGEGYYTGKLEACLREKGISPRVAGFDISKSAVRAAAGKYKGCQFAVASAFAVPAADASADCLTNVFAPIVPEECKRVVKPGGVMILAVPGPRHLYGLKEILYDAPYENEYRETEYPGFVFVRRETVAETLILDNGEQIQNLFAMTPYYWKTPESGSRRLAQTAHLETEIRFDFLIYRRK